MVRDICAATGLKESTLRGWACELQIPLRGLGGPREEEERNKERDAQIAELALSNEISQNGLGARFGVSGSRVGQVLRRICPERILRWRKNSPARR